MRRIRDDGGLSLTELLVVSVLMGVILATMYLLFGAASTIADRSTARAIATDEAQRAIDTMSREIRESQENRTPNDDSKGGVFTIAEPNRVQFFSDVNHDNGPELVTYYLSGSSLLRTVAPWNQAPTNTQPWTFGSAGTPKALVTNIDTAGGPIFCYHSKSPGTASCARGTYAVRYHGFWILGSGGTVTAPYDNKSPISMIGINLVNKQPSSGGNYETALSDSLVRLRASQNAE
ncbi:MAG: type II secretion system protein [Coriobacteriia bacterium]